jgi:hypothetical protein
MNQVIEKKLIYMNNAASSYPKPVLVRNLVTEAFNKPPLENQRSTYIDEPDMIG